jgi:hypothetical protein
MNHYSGKQISREEILCWFVANSFSDLKAFNNRKTCPLKRATPLSGAWCYRFSKTELGIWSLGFGICFGFRISGFGFNPPGLRISDLNYIPSLSIFCIIS